MAGFVTWSEFASVHSTVHYMQYHAVLECTDKF